MKQKTQLITQ